MEDTSSWAPEPYNISSTPSCTSVLNISEQIPGKDFARTVKWCSDSSSILALTESATFQRFDSGTPQQPSPVRIYPQPGPVLDYTWYPTASLHDPTTFCFVASVRECPVKLLDAADGRLRASYKIVDHRERQIAPHCLTFNLTAQRLYCGFQDAIEIFDLSRPGEGTRLHTTPSKKSKDGLKGIISALAFSPSYNPDASFYAAGTLNTTAQNIAMFSDAQDEPLMYLGGGPKAGVTQLRFNPMRPHILYARYRGHACETIYSWDVRSAVDAPLEVFQTSPTAGPEAHSNQKKLFDIDVAGRLLSMGGQDGSVSVFALDSTDGVFNANSTGEPIFHYPDLRYTAHKDAVGSVQFHPFRPVLLSSSGSRHFIPEIESGDELENSDGDLVRARQKQPVTFDCSIKIWELI